jgi:hypothetical protein
MIFMSNSYKNKPALSYNFRIRKQGGKSFFLLNLSAFFPEKLPSKNRLKFWKKDALAFKKSGRNLVRNDGFLMKSWIPYKR